MEQMTTPLPDHGIFTYADKDSTRHVSAGRLRAWLTQGPDERIEALERRLDTLLETDGSSAIDNFREILRFLEGMTDDERLAARLADIQSRLDGLGERVDANEAAIADAPELAFRELWKSAGCSVDEAAEPSEMYLCNGLGMSYAEARAVYAAGVMTNVDINARYAGMSIRTHLPSQIRWGASAPASTTFRGSSVEVVAAPLLTPGTGCFRDCTKLRKASVFSPRGTNAGSDAWAGCKALETLTVAAMLPGSFSLADSPLISLASLQGIISKAWEGMGAATITLHPGTYAKMTDTERETEWTQLPELAAAKNITFTTTE